MRLLCIDDSDCVEGKVLTYNKVYYADPELQDRTDCWSIIDDRGYRFGYYKRRFIELDVIRNDKIDIILDGLKDI